MCDNNSNNEKKEDILMKDGKNSYIFLKDLAIDFEETLFTIKMQIKTQEDFLSDKQQALNEIERTKIHNQDIFSPINSEYKNSLSLFSEIDFIKNKLNELENQKKILENKINSILTAANYIESISNNHEKILNLQDSEYRQKLADKGLGILEAQEIERQRIARDLHDSTVQNLTSLVHKSELCIKLIDIDTIRAKLELNAMSNTLKMIINDMRGIIYNLKPMTLDDLGLTITIQRLANKLMNMGNVDVKVNSNDEIKEILPVIKLTVFRIIQEACNNIIKHANATFIYIDIKYDKTRINVTVTDNGIGFNINNTVTHNGSEQSSSFGLSIMQERISLLSGNIDIISKKGEGTIVSISVPLAICEGEER